MDDIMHLAHCFVSEVSEAYNPLSILTVVR